MRESYDPECESLALYFLREEWGNNWPPPDNLVRSLSQSIQDAIEAWHAAELSAALKGNGEGK